MIIKLQLWLNKKEFMEYYEKNYLLELILSINYFQSTITSFSS